MTTALTPVSARERVVTLDILRGFALLGVLLANLFVLYSYRFASRGPGQAESLADSIAHWFLRLTVESRAQTLLTFLFGFGFAAQLLRADARGERVLPIYLRRLFALLAIGWFHVLFLSWVDVTWGYAMVGFFLLPFTRVSNTTRLVIAAVLTLIPAAVYAIPDVWPTLHSLFFDEPPPAYIARFVTAARSGDRLAIMHAHAVLGLLWTFGGGIAWYLPWLLGRFLLGFVAGSLRIFDNDGADHLPFFTKLLVIGALVSLPGIALPIAHELVAFELILPVQMLVAVIGALALLGQVAAYVAAVVLLVQRPLWRRILAIIAPIGRMPLTTYLMQSLICTTLFYGWGFNWQTPSPAPCVALGFAIFALQIVFAHLWLRFFRFGPAEWLWRTIVYWQLQPMR